MISNFIIPLSTVVVTEKEKWDSMVHELKTLMPGKLLPPGFSLYIMDIKNHKIFLFNNGKQRVFSLVPDTKCSIIRYIKRIKPSLLIDISNSFSSCFTAIFTSPGKYIRKIKKLEKISCINSSDMPDTEKILSFIKSLFSHEEEFISGSGNPKKKEKSKTQKTDETENKIIWIPPRNGSRKMWNHYVEMKNIADEEKKELKIFFRNSEEQKKFLSVFYTRGRIEELQEYEKICSNKTENLLKLSKTSTETVFSSSGHPMYRTMRKKGYTKNKKEGGSIPLITTFFKYRKKRRYETKQNNFA